MSVKESTIKITSKRYTAHAAKFDSRARFLKSGDTRLLLAMAVMRLALYRVRRPVRGVTLRAQ